MLLIVVVLKNVRILQTCVCCGPLCFGAFRQCARTDPQRSQHNMYIKVAAVFDTCFLCHTSRLHRVYCCSAQGKILSAANTTAACVSVPACFGVEARLPVPEGMAY